VRIGTRDGATWNGVLARSEGRWLLRAETPGKREDDREFLDGPPLVLVMALLKGDRTEWAIQKATETGVREVHVVVMRHSVSRPEGPESERKARRLQRVALEAARQCGRATAPGVLLWPRLEAALPALDRWKDPDLPRWMLDERPGAPPLAVALRRAPGAILAAGPEGSFDDEERRQLLRNGFRPAGLGPRVLRSETAAMVGLVVAQVVCGDLGDAVSCPAPEGTR